MARDQEKPGMTSGFGNFGQPSGSGFGFGEGATETPTSVAASPNVVPTPEFGVKSTVPGMQCDTCAINATFARRARLRRHLHDLRVP
ncbi:hypothetical protein EDD22DRAFT_957207 [Suillus occidentalis]|nr:hypothetical protein EDD22DRAFT_957207 [Suillus occidentalis]